MDKHHLNEELEDNGPAPHVYDGSPSDIKIIMSTKSKNNLANSKKTTQEPQPEITSSGTSISVHTYEDRDAVYKPYIKYKHTFNPQMTHHSYMKIGNKSHPVYRKKNLPAGIPVSFLVNTAPVCQTNESTVNNFRNYNYNVYHNPQVPMNSDFTDSSPSNFNTEMQYNDQTINKPLNESRYSPSDNFSGEVNAQEFIEGLESIDNEQAGQKRLSAFQRLGPMTVTKKPKLTINLSVSEEQSVREVVDATNKAENDEVKCIPVHLRDDILNSEDDIVKKLLPVWPYTKNLVIRKTVGFKKSKSVMIIEKEQMVEEVYTKDVYILVVAKGYPPHWKKEDVLDAILVNINGKHFIPTFIEFNSEECKFLVIRSLSALDMIHKLHFTIKHKGCEIALLLSYTGFSFNHLDMIPKLVIGKRMAKQNSDKTKLDLSEFLMKSDVSHFIYFPLNFITNQMELIDMQSQINWRNLIELNLSGNRLSDLQGFNIIYKMPNLKHLDLSYNNFEKITYFLVLRGLPLKSINLEGNPLCCDHTDPRRYMQLLKMMFSELVEIDGTKVHLYQTLPTFVKNHCPEYAKPVVDTFLDTYFNILDLPSDERPLVKDMYCKDAMLTVTYRQKLKTSHIYRYYQNILMHARSTDEIAQDVIVGDLSIAKHLTKWPELKHDPYSFTVDVLYHSDLTTVVKISGMLKLTAISLADDEPLLYFTRTLVLVSENEIEYKIQNEMLYFDEPTTECATNAFKVAVVRQKKLSLKLESLPNTHLKKSLIKIFMQLTTMDECTSERCLEKKSWNLQLALEYFVRNLKLDNLEAFNFKEAEPVK